mmetsp:Transcript_15756/g.47279  ORF Transcript_15756/g.47279 Transcript_15756/m.47279 type:complete len:622 (+) Transcript_15756:113-1978(+)
MDTSSLLRGTSVEKGWYPLLTPRVWRCRPDWLAFLLGPAVSVPFAACYAALVCRMPALQSYFPEVFQQIMWTQLAGSVLLLFLGQFVTTTNMDPLVAVLFSQLAYRVQADFGLEPEALGPHMMLVMPLTTALLGVALYAVGRFRLARMLRFLPYTVVAGFLAGSGVLILLESLALAAGEELLALARATLRATGADLWAAASAWLQVVLALAYAHSAALARDAHALGTPAMLVISISASVAAKLGTEGAWPPASWYLTFPGGVEWWSPFASLAGGLRHFQPSKAVHWEMTASFVTTMTVSWSINTLAVAKLVPLKPGLRHCDEQTEIQSLGLVNIGLGALGCHASMQSFKIPMIMRDVDAGRMWPLFNLAVNLVIFLASPRIIIEAVPRFIFAGNVVRLGADLVQEWLVQAKRRIAFNEWCVVAMTSLVTSLDVSLGILFGLFSALVLFAVEYSNATGVTRHASLAEVQSAVPRSDAEHEFLVTYGHCVQILWLNGYLFFGWAAQVADEVRQTVEDASVQSVVLDFSHVPAVDASGVYAVVDLAEELYTCPQLPRLVLCGLAPCMEAALRGAASTRRIDVKMAKDINGAMQHCEDDLIRCLARRGIHPEAEDMVRPKVHFAG